MNVEKLQYKGMLAEAKKKYRTLDTEASGLIILIRTLLNPYTEVLTLDIEKILVSINRLHSITSEMNSLKKKINNLESEIE